MNLKDWPLPEVRIVCTKCGLEASLPREQIAAVFGEEAELFEIRADMTQGCVPTKNEVCQSRLADALLVQAMLEPDEEKVIDKDLLPKARAWREEHGLSARNAA
jgi:hypothetical protein